MAATALQRQRLLLTRQNNLGPLLMAEQAFELFCCIKPSLGQGVGRTQCGSPPAIDAAPPHAGTGFADHAGGFWGALLLGQGAATKAQQLGHGGGAAFPALEPYQGKIGGAGTHVEHQHQASRGQAGAEGGCGGLIHQGHFIHIQVFGPLLQPLAVMLETIDRRGEHQALGMQALGQLGPNSLQ